ncbi:MAG TPA: nucleotidyltransferase domain-containing protein [Candidatus Nanoarchaeia archaeon]|nr:nucleotidyltransferase domain-containing protein [Candidatus Nanoarchaeia archaeon]
MVLKLEHILGSKNSISVLRFLTQKPNRAFGLTDLSQELNISKSNLIRVLRPLTQEKLVIELQSGRKKTVQINGEQRLIETLWKLFMQEKQMNLSSEYKNIIDLFFQKHQDEIEVFILFGSVSRGLAKKDSDIDLLIIGDKKLSGPILELPYRFELHNYTWKELEEKTDFVVLDCLINGIVYKGKVFKIIKELNAFPKSYLIYRLNKCKEYLTKSKSLKGESKKYFLNLAKVTLGEIKSILRNKKTIPKQNLKSEATFKNIAEIEQELAKEGENLWLI